MREESNKNIEDLKKRIVNSTYSEAIPFVGAGSSIPLGLPSWEGLVKDFHNHINCKIDFEELKTKYDRDWATIADVIYNDIEDNSKQLQIYKEFMSNKFLPKSCYWTSVHLDIIDIFQKIITTNYDRAFEDALDRNKVHENYTPEIQKSYDYDKFIYPENLDYNTLQHRDKRWLIYLHGRNDSKQYVFREAEYRLAYETDTKISNFLDFVMKDYPIIFLGFSFDDIVFKNKLEEIIRLKRNRIQQYKAVHGIETEIEGELKGLYVIINEKNLDESIHKEKYAKLIEGYEEQVSSFIDVVPLKSKNNHIKINLLNEKTVVFNEINKIMEPDKSKNLIHIVKQLLDIKNKNDYFDKNEIKPIKYSGNHTEIIEILKEISKYKVGSNDQDLPNTI